MLRVEDIDVFHGDAQALDGVSIEIPQGSIVAIVGANGAGKTSLIRTIAGMHRPARGRITFHGTDITGWESHRVCNLGIGQVAEGRQIFPSLTVAENLEVGAMLPRARTSRARNLESVLAMFPVLAERSGQAAGTPSISRTRETRTSGAPGGTSSAPATSGPAPTASIRRSLLESSTPRRAACTV